MSETPRDKPISVLLMSNMYPSAAEPGYGSFVQRQEERLARRHGVRFRLVASRQRGGGMGNLGKYAGLLLRALAETVRGGYDLVHAHYLLPVAAFSLIPAVVRKKPLVITAHGTDIYTGTWRGWKRWITKALLRACRIVVVSEFLAEELANNFDLPREIRSRFIIANMGVDSELFTPDDTAARKTAVGLPEHVPHLLFVGNFVEQKGVTDLARALVLLEERGVDVRTTLLGHGPQMAEVRRIVAPLGEKVRFRSVVEHELLVDVFRSADLFVLPSRREGVGLLVCLEALSCGVPVAAGRTGGLPEIVHNGVNGALFPAEDPAACADAIERLVTDRVELARLASGARASALPYGEDEQADRVYKAYRECARS